MLEELGNQKLPDRMRAVRENRSSISLLLLLVLRRCSPRLSTSWTYKQHSLLYAQQIANIKSASRYQTGSLAAAERRWKSDLSQLLTPGPGVKSVLFIGILSQQLWVMPHQLNLTQKEVSHYYSFLMFGRTCAKFCI